jgi:hypothetical protein
MSRKSRIPQLAGTGLHALDTLPVADDGGSLAARSALAGRLSTLIEEQTRDDKPTAMPAVVPRTLTLIRRYRLRRLSLDHLIRALVALDQHVEIVVRAKGDEDEGGIVTRIK